MQNPPLANAIAILEVVVIAAIAWRLGRLRWFFRVPLAALLGWPVVIFCTAMLWEILAASAQTRAESDWVAAHDSGPLAMTLVFGWAYALIIVLVVEMFRALVSAVRRFTASRQGV
jgi:hypothetical protein